MPIHPRAAKLGLDGFGFDIAAICFSNRFSSDGRIQPDELKLIFPGVTAAAAAKMAGRLVAAGRWEPHPDGGWQIHDFLDFNPSRAQVFAERAAAAARQRARRSRALGVAPDTSNVNHASSHAVTHGVTEGEVTPGVRDPVPSRPVPSRAEPSPDTGLRPAPGTAVPGTKRAASKKGNAGSGTSTEPGTMPDSVVTVVPMTQTVAGEPTGVRAVIAEYARLFEQKTGSKPAINWGRDGAIAKELIELYGGGETGTSRVIALLRRYFESDDEWIRTKSGYTFPAFKGQANRLAAELARPASSRVEHINAVGEESKRLLHEAMAREVGR